MRQRKPWEEPVRYNEDRFDAPQPFPHHQEHGDPPRRGASDNGEERDAAEVEELLNRPEGDEERHYECNDTTPINYTKGPHDEELGVDDNQFDEPDSDLIPYDQGPHDNEFGVEDDEDDFEPLDDEDDDDL